MRKIFFYTTKSTIPETHNESHGIHIDQPVTRLSRVILPQRRLRPLFHGIARPHPLLADVVAFRSLALQSASEEEVKRAQDGGVGADDADVHLRSVWEVVLAFD